jgi:uncharacterized membrane protein YeaQ/YmgE (transglycosylase-associated protein family)
MDALNRIAETLGADVNTIGVWAGAGFLLGLIMIGRRPLGLIGDLLLGIIGGAAGGWAFNYFDESVPAIDLGQYAQRVASSLSEQSAGYIGAFAEAFIGAFVLLILARLFVRR